MKTPSRCGIGPPRALGLRLSAFLAVDGCLDVHLGRSPKTVGQAAKSRTGRFVGPSENSNTKPRFWAPPTTSIFVKRVEDFLPDDLHCKFGKPHAMRDGCRSRTRYGCSAGRRSMMNQTAVRSPLRSRLPDNVTTSRPCHPYFDLLGPPSSISSSACGSIWASRRLPAESPPARRVSSNAPGFAAASCTDRDIC